MSTSHKPQGKRRKSERQPIKFTSLKQLVELNLEKKKLDLMKDSIFESLLSVTNKRESSSILVSKLLNIYDPVKRVFQLNDNICLSFCKKEVAKVLGMNDSGRSFADYEKTCPNVSTFPDHLKLLKEKFAADGKTKITLLNIKDILKNMTVDDEGSKVQFKQLMTYFLIEGMLRCGSDSKKPRCKTWGLVTKSKIEDCWNEECWKVNWAEEVDNHLHFSLRTCKEMLKSEPHKQHTFMGATPVLEAIIYERIPKLRPDTSSAVFPPIQKYKSTRKEVDNVLRDLEANDVEVCPHCTLPVENTQDSHSPLAAENSPDSVSLGDQFRGLSLSCGGVDVGTSDSLSGPSTNLPFGDANVGESGGLVHQGLPNVVDRSEELVLYDDAEVKRLNLKCEKRELVKKVSPPSDSLAVELPVIVSSPQSGVTCVQGYTVKNIYAPILESIFKKHGDIAATCVFKTSSARESILEVVCEVVRKIQTNDVTAIISDMEEIESQVSGAEAIKINVAWLRAHLEAIHKRTEAKKKCSLLMKMNANTSLVTIAAEMDLKEILSELTTVQERFEKAKR